jgi:hypothetical protein
LLGFLSSYDLIMSDLGDVLELLHTAHLRPLAVKATMRHWRDRSLYDDALARWQKRQEDELSSKTVRLRSRALSTEETLEDIFEVWHQRPGPLWRVEHAGRGQGYKLDITIINGRRWWLSKSGEHFWTNIRPDGSFAENVGGGLPGPGLETLFDPAPVVAVTTLSEPAATSHLGRAAVRVRGGLYVGKESRQVHAFAIGSPFADQVELTVDRETGVLLLVRLSVDGGVFMVWEVTAIDFDPDVNPSMFEGPHDAEVPSFKSVVALTKPWWSVRALVRRGLRKFAC